MIKLDTLRLTKGSITSTAQAPLACIKAIRSHSAAVLKSHANGTPGVFDESALTNFLPTVDAILDLRAAKHQHTANVAIVDAALAALHGEPVDAQHAQHPIVVQARELQREAAAVKSVDPTLAAADIGEVVATFIELQAVLLEHTASLENNYTKTLRFTRQAAAAALADVQDLGAALTELEKRDLKLTDILPGHWQIDPLPSLPTKATMNPASKLGSPERTASVLHTQLNRGRSDDRQAQRAKEKSHADKAKRLVTDTTLAELKELLR